MPTSNPFEAFSFGISPLNCLHGRANDLTHKPALHRCTSAWSYTTAPAVLRAGGTFGAGSGASPHWVLRIEESSSYLQEVCNYSVLRQKAPEQERIASTLSIEIQVFNQQ